MAMFIRIRDLLYLVYIVRNLVFYVMIPSDKTQDMVFDVKGIL